ncbi:MAG: Caudovirus prohead protease [Syntrophorhabdaceae bacterium PtaU1.Bin034]|nr:MAG: Caudovirus prohead protease [Syntrophorhabdaceae bacterium PtaU1.Bin034]
MAEKRVSRFERRNFPVTELRAITDDKGLRHITGYAAVFNSLSDDLGWFREKIDPGAFSETIKTDDIRALWNHDSNYPLGRNKSGTLSLSEDAHGLKIDVQPPDTQWARDLMTSIDRGDVDQMSFGFETLSDRWETVDKQEIRTLIKVRLFDVSPVTFPAYPDTEVGLRSLEEYRKTAGPSTDEAERTANPLIGLGLLKEEDSLYRKIKGIKEADHE